MRVPVFLVLGCLTSIINVLCISDDDQKRVRCPRPFVSNGHFLDPRSEFMPKSIVFVSCDIGFHLRHGFEHKLVCAQNGEWIGSSNETPECIESGCYSLPSFLNSSVSYDGSNILGDRHDEGTTARYVCGRRTRKKEVVTLRCFRGTWLGIAKINCGQMLRCGPPKDVSNAEIVVQNRSKLDRADSYPIGTTIFYRCVSGYVSKSSTPPLQCMPNGKWWPQIELPIFNSVNANCPQPPSISFGFIVDDGRRRNLSFSTVTYACNPNYHLEGPSRKTCDATKHEWQPTARPRCSPIVPTIGDILKQNALKIVFCLALCFLVVILVSIRCPCTRGGRRSTWYIVATVLLSKRRRDEWEARETEAQMQPLANGDGLSMSVEARDGPPSYEEALSQQSRSPPIYDVRNSSGHQHSSHSGQI